MTADATTNETSEKPPRALFWPAFVITLLSAQVVLWLSMLYMASTDPTFAVEPDYYQKGQQWNTTHAQLLTNQELGWKLKLDISRPAGTMGVRTLTATLINRDKRPLDGAQIAVEAFPYLRGNERLHLDLPPLGDGRYAIETRLRRAGVWEFRFTVSRGPDVFTAIQRHDITTPKGMSG